MTADEKSYWRNPAVSATAVEADLFLVEPEGQDVYYLDAVTSGIWRLLETPLPRDAILRIYSEAFPEVAAEEIARDVAAAFEDMVARGLVVIAPETRPPGSGKSDP